MKRVLFLCIAVLAVVPLVMAGGQGGRAGSSAAARTNLRVLLSEEPSSGDALMTTLRKWAAETGKTVEPMVIPYDDQLTKFPLMARNRDLPDLVFTTRLTRLYPDEFIDFTSQIDISLFEPMALEIIGQDYSSKRNACLPLQFTITIAYYNADAFAKAGLQPPTVNAPWTVDQLFANGKILQEKGGVKYGVAMDFSRARYDNMMYMNGGSMVVQDGNAFKVAINSQQNIDALQTFVDANNNGIMPKAIWAGGSTDNPGDYFKNGDVGIYFSGTWNYNAFTNDITAFNWAIMPSPSGKTGRSAILGGSGLAIPQNAPGKELAMDFVRWLYTNPKNFQDYLALDKGMSSLKGVSYTPPNAKIATDYQVMQAEVSNVSPLFGVDESSSWRNYKDNEYRNYLKQAVNGDITPSAALNDFAKELSESSKWAIR
jgi:alpha-1,4-digalacturonate transport system substrate-binding protein